MEGGLAARPVSPPDPAAYGATTGANGNNDADDAVSVRGDALVGLPARPRLVHGSGTVPAAAHANTETDADFRPPMPRPVDDAVIGSARHTRCPAQEGVPRRFGDAAWEEALASLQQREGAAIDELLAENDRLRGQVAAEVAAERVPAHAAAVVDSIAADAAGHLDGVALLEVRAAVRS